MVMSNFLLSVHVLGAILAIGPVAVAASMFPPAARRALADSDDAKAAAIARILHRITRVYAVIGILVPVFGVATAVSMGILTQLWLLVAMSLTALAAVVLIFWVIPLQTRLIAEIDHRDAESQRGEDRADAASAAGAGDAIHAAGAVTGPSGDVAVRASGTGVTKRLAMTTGVFNLLWAVVVVMMIYRPGQEAYL